MLKLFGLVLLMLPGAVLAGPLATIATSIGSSILGASGAAALGTVGTGIVGAGAAALGAKSLFGGKAKAPAAPAAPAAAVMPTPDDASVQAAKRKRIAEIQGRQGRASTILSDADTLG